MTTTAEGTVALAQSMIETHCGRTEDAVDSFRLKDLVWLKKAVAWQAAWLPSQPGIMARMSASSVSQDGMSSSFNSPADMTLAPLAQRALKSCSWMGSRSIRTRSRTPLPPEEMAVASAASWLREGSDHEGGWDEL